MAETQYNFRTALQGFNRTDVVNFLEELTTRHAEEVRALEEENDRLRRKVETLEQISWLQTPSFAAELPTAEESPLPEENDEAWSMVPEELRAVQRSLSGLPTVTPEIPEQSPAAQEAPASIQEAPTPSQLEAMELAAYRRAERVERMASERAEEMLNQLMTVRDQTDADLQQSDEKLTELTKRLAADIEALQQAMSTVHNALDQGCDSIRSLQIGAEEQA